MHVAIGIIAVFGTVALVIGALAGKVRVRSCCVPAEHDLRMRDGTR